MADVETPIRKLQVANARPEDSGRGLAHVPRALLAALPPDAARERLLAEVLAQTGLRPPASVRRRRRSACPHEPPSCALSPHRRSGLSCPQSAMTSLRC